MNIRNGDAENFFMENDLFVVCSGFDNVIE